MSAGQTANRSEIEFTADVGSSAVSFSFEENEIT